MYLNKKKQLIIFLLYSLFTFIFLKLMWNEFDNFYYINITFYNTFLVYLGLAILLIWVKLLFKITSKTFLLFSVVLCVAFFLETTLRFVVKYPLSYTESNGSPYRSIQKNLPNDIISVLEQANKKDAHTIEYAPHTWRGINILNKNITVQERYNKLGMRGHIPKRKYDLVVALGDSFTESMCVQYEDSYPKKLEKKLRDRKFNFGVLNAGTAGNDPFFDWKMLQKLNSQFTIHSAIFLINHTDISDIVIRGGHERFLENGLLKYNEAPSWERIYALSFIFRNIVKTFFKLDYNFNTPKQAKQKNDEALKKLHNLFKQDILPFCKANGIDLFVATHPLSWNLDFLSDPYFEIVEALSSIDGLVFIDTFESLNDENEINENLYIPNDLHFSERGYEIIANDIAQGIIQFYNFKNTNDISNNTSI